MSDDFMMRFRLQQVLAYRELCRLIRNSGRGNIFFAGLMFFLAYYTFQPKAGGFAAVIYMLYIGLAVAELAVGVFKWLFPSAEGVLFDAILQLVFAGWNLGWQAFFFFVLGMQPQIVIVVLGIFMLTGSLRRFKNYADLRKAFADRPTAEQIAWFDDLIYEIRHADPTTDDLALDLPTRPHWKAKMLGTTAFFVPKSGTEVLIAGPFDFSLTPVENAEHSDHLRVRLFVLDRSFKPFEIDEASWANYRKWMAEQSRS